MADLYVSINEDYFTRTKATANKESIKQSGEPTPNMCWPNLGAKCESFEIKEGSLEIAFSCDLGYFSFNYALDKDDRIELLEDSLRLVSKFKAAIEALK